MEDLEKVSIILPTYNGSRFLRRSIDSCLNQTHKNIELIIVDDGSTNETKEIVDSYSDRRMSYVKHEVNRGLSAALNTGFSRSSGKYLSWTSDDNYYSLNAIEKMLNFIEKTECSFVYCDFYRLMNDDASDAIVIRLPFPPNLERENTIGACFLYSRKVWETIGEYDSDANLAEDFDYWIRISKRFNICHLDEPLYSYLLHDFPESDRQLKVQIMSLLVLIKNNLIDTKTATDRFILLVTKRTRAWRIKIRFIALPVRFVAKSLVKLRLSHDVKRILDEVMAKSTNLQTAKSSLYDIVGRI